MAIVRKPFQGVFNIIRFNWHFYAIALLVFLCLFFVVKSDLIWFALFAFAIAIPLIISYYVYDVSDLYELPWLNKLSKEISFEILNIHAGFDETSLILKEKFPKSTFIVGDFYNAKKHTEISIKRARKIYPSSVDTIRVSTDKLPFSNNVFDYSLVVLSAHEIRNENERIQFFKELSRVTKNSIYVTEHLRDFNNFIAYTIGFFHFYSCSNWFSVIDKSGLCVIEKTKTTPFITTFVLEKNGNTH